MNIRTKYRLSIVIWFISGSILGLAAMYITKYFLIPLFVVGFVIGVYGLSLKCPNCGKRVLYNPLKIFRMEFYIWTSWIPKNCTKCNMQL